MPITGDSVEKNTSAKQETGGQSLGQEDPLKKEMATGSSILAWEITWTEEPGGFTVHGIVKSDRTEHPCSRLPQRTLLYNSHQ